MSIESDRIAHVLSALRDGQKRGRWKKKEEGEERFRVQIGNYKNGNPKYGTECGICGVQEITNKKGFWNTDHVIPVRTVSGFVDFNTEVERMLPDKYGYAKICEICHKEKTDKEKDLRKKYRNAKTKTEKDQIEKEFNEYGEKLKEKLKNKYP